MRSGSSASSNGAEQSVGICGIAQLGRLQNAVIYRAVGVIDSLIPDDGTVIFKLSCGDGITQDEIVNDLGIDKGAVARIIKSLIDKGLIEKNKDEVDKRCNRVFLTEKGKQAIEPIKKSIEKWNGIVTKNMSDKEEKELKRLLLMSIENIKEEI